MDALPAVIASITALIAALGALWVNVQNSRKASAAKVKAEVDAEKKRLADEAAAKVIADAVTAGAVAAEKAASAVEAARVAAERAEAQIIATKDGVFEVGERLDGRLQALLEITAANARAAGRAEGIAAEQERAAIGGASIPAAIPTTPAVPLPVTPSAPTEVRVVQDVADPALRVVDEPKT